MFAAILDALSVLLPVTCAGCSADDRALCSPCRTQLVSQVRVQNPGDELSVCSSLRYEGIVRNVVLAFKEAGRTDVASALALPLAVAVRHSATLSSGPGGLQIVVVPVSRQAYRRRGYDPVRLLLRRAGFGAPQNVLVAVRRRDEQKGLDREARAINLAGTLAVRGDVRGARLLLVDDVVTTGATMLEAARTLRAAGATVIGAAVLASTPRLFGDSQDAHRLGSDIYSQRV